MSYTGTPEPTEYSFTSGQVPRFVHALGVEEFDWIKIGQSLGQIVSGVMSDRHLSVEDLADSLVLAPELLEEYLDPTKPASMGIYFVSAVKVLEVKLEHVFPQAEVSEAEVLWERLQEYLETVKVESLIQVFRFQPGDELRENFHRTFRAAVENEYEKYRSEYQDSDVNGPVPLAEWVIVYFQDMCANHDLDSSGQTLLEFYRNGDPDRVLNEFSSGSSLGGFLDVFVMDFYTVFPLRCLSAGEKNELEVRSNFALEMNLRREEVGELVEPAHEVVEEFERLETDEPAYTDWPPDEAATGVEAWEDNEEQVAFLSYTDWRPDGIATDVEALESNDSYDDEVEQDADNDANDEISNEGGTEEFEDSHVYFWLDGHLDSILRVTRKLEDHPG